MSSESKNQTLLVLDDAVRRMGRMAAARANVSLSRYVNKLIRRDCELSGIAALVQDDTESEVRDGGE